MSRAPALGTGPERAELQRRLLEGECAPEALRGAYGQINRQTLRALVAELGACNRWGRPAEPGGGGDE